MLALKRRTFSLQISSLLTRSFLSVAANKKRNDKKWQVASPVVNEKHESCRKVMGITVTPKLVVWALLDTTLSEIVDCGSCPFFDEKEQFSHATILHSAFRAFKNMPASDLYVLEEGWSTGSKPTAVLTKTMATFDAMLSALLSEGYDPEDPFHKVFHMNPKVVTKLFGLQAGNERMSSQYIIRKMIKSSSVLGCNFEHQIIEEAASEDEKAYWIYRLCWTDVERAKLIWGKDHVWRENVSNSILIATAFTDLCLKVNPAAQSIFFRRTPIVPSIK